MAITGEMQMLNAERVEQLELGKSKRLTGSSP